MNGFFYRVTLVSGAVGEAENGILLDRMIAGRTEDVKTIEVITVISQPEPEQ